jgi:DNA-binding response OmpR family regulator
MSPRMSFLNDRSAINAHDSPAFKDAILRFAEAQRMSDLLDGLRVLLLEDEPLIAMDVEQLCLDNGAAEVITVRALEEIDPQAAVSSVDVAIVDLMLSGVSTFDFARRLQQAGKPFIFASGHSDADEVQASFPEVAFVAKPYAGADLVNAVAAACGRLSPA